MTAPTPASITTTIQQLAPSAVIEMYQLDLTSVGGPILYYHGGTSGTYESIVWQGQVYYAFPVQTTGFEWNGRGQLPRPKIQVANVTGAITALILLYGDLIGCKVTRKRTFAQFLDSINFPQSTNLLLWSNQMNQSESWLTYNCSVVANAGADPFGSNTANEIVRTATGNDYLYQSVAMASALNKFTFSIWLQSGTMTGNVLLRLRDGNQTEYANVSIATTPTWTRYSVTAQFPAGAAFGVYIYIDPANDVGAAGDTFYAYGAQLEIAGTPSAYQPTTNGVNPSADPTAEFPDDIFFIEQRTVENRNVVEFQLAAAFDFQGFQLPRRPIIQNVCAWIYRSSECGYTGTAYFDANDNPVPTAAQDVCGKRLSSCQARFGGNNPLPFGGFPAAGLTRA